MLRDIYFSFDDTLIILLCQPCNVGWRSLVVAVKFRDNYVAYNRLALIAAAIQQNGTGDNIRRIFCLLAFSPTRNKCCKWCCRCVSAVGGASIFDPEVVCSNLRSTSLLCSRRRKQRVETCGLVSTARIDHVFSEWMVYDHTILSDSLYHTKSAGQAYSI